MAKNNKSKKAPSKSKGSDTSESLTTRKNIVKEAPSENDEIERRQREAVMHQDNSGK